MKSNKPFNRPIDIRYDGNDYFSNIAGPNFQGLSEVAIYAQFHDIGQTSIELSSRYFDQNASSSLDFTVLKGNAIQITQIKILSTEFATCNCDPNEDGENQYPDIVLKLYKQKINPFYGTEYEIYQKVWRETSFKQNAQNLNWDLEAQNFYLKPEVPIVLIQYDHDQSSDSILTFNPDGNKIVLADYADTRPTTIVKELGEMTVELTIDWN